MFKMWHSRLEEGLEILHHDILQVVVPLDLVIITISKRANEVCASSILSRGMEVFGVMISFFQPKLLRSLTLEDLLLSECFKELLVGHLIPLNRLAITIRLHVLHCPSTIIDSLALSFSIRRIRKVSYF